MTIDPFEPNPEHFPRDGSLEQDPAPRTLQEDPPLDSFPLHPIDQEILETTGGLPALPLLVNPEVLERLRSRPPSVHTIETTDRNSTEGAERSNPDNPDFPRSQDSHREDYTYRGFLLKPRRAAYERALEIYRDQDGDREGKFTARLKDCRRHAWFVQSKVTKKLRIQSSRCKLRWCPICRDVSRSIVTRAVDDWLQIQKYPKMLTLTMKHNDDPLQLQIKHLYDCFRKFRQRAFFHRKVTGGVWFFQLKYNERSEQWHPHIHCLIAGQFLPHNQLKTLWHKVTGDSHVVDIRPVKDLENASTEVARYATSPADLSAVNIKQALDIHYATKNRRICGSWGTAKKIKLSPQKQDDTEEWVKVADFYFVNIQRSYSYKIAAFWRCYKLGHPYDGPQIQEDRDVFRDEMDILMSLEDLPKTDAEWYMRLKRNRDGPWTKFFEKKEETTCTT